MIRLSDFCNSKDLWSVGYGYIGCDDSNEWSFGGPEDKWSIWVLDDEWYVWVSDIKWIILGSTLDSP